MGTRTGYEPGAFCWVDLSSSDPDAAKRFYAELFGWDYEDREGAGGTYSMARVQGADVAAIVRQDPQEAERGVPSHFNNYVWIEDAAATLARAGELGANVLGDAFDVETAGRIGVFIDPVGAALCLWQPQDHRGAGLVNEPGCLTWNELGTTEVDAAARFYAELFGWGTRPMEAAGGEYVVVSVGARSNGGIRQQSPDEVAAGVPSNWMPYFAVESAEATLHRAAEIGGATLFGPMEIPNGGRIAAIQDAQGAVCAIWEGELED